MYRESPKKDDSFSSFKMNKNNNIYIYIIYNYGKFYKN